MLAASFFFFFFGLPLVSGGTKRAILSRTSFATCAENRAQTGCGDISKARSLHETRTLLKAPILSIYSNKCPEVSFFISFSLLPCRGSSCFRMTIRHRTSLCGDAVANQISSVSLQDTCGVLCLNKDLSHVFSPRLVSAMQCERLKCLSKQTTIL